MLFPSISIYSKSGQAMNVQCKLKSYWITNGPKWSIWIQIPFPPRSGGDSTCICDSEKIIKIFNKSKVSHKFYLYVCKQHIQELF